MTDAELRTAYADAIAARASEARVSCPAAESMQALVERTAPEADRLATLDHIMQCAHCTTEFELLRALREGRPAPRVSLPLRWLAAAAIAGLVLTSTLVWRRNGEDDRPMRDSASALVIHSPSDAVAPEAARTLIWGSAPGASRYLVEFMSGDSVLYSAELRDTVLSLPDTVGTHAGAQYGWWVRIRYPDGAERTSRFVHFTVSEP